MAEGGELFGLIADEDTCTGFLLGGVGEINDRKQLNFFIVEEGTSASKIEEKFRSFVSRKDISIILINQHVADRIRDVLDQYKETIPTVLEIPSKNHIYNNKKVKQLIVTDKSENEQDEVDGKSDVKGDKIQFMGRGTSISQPNPRQCRCRYHGVVNCVHCYPNENSTPQRYHSDGPLRPIVAPPADNFGFQGNFGFQDNFATSPLQAYGNEDENVRPFSFAENQDDFSELSTPKTSDSNDTNKHTHFNFEIYYPFRHTELPQLPIVMEKFIPTLRHVPKRARNRWARILRGSLSSICSDPVNIDNWTKLFMAAKCILASPAEGHRLQWSDISKLVDDRMDKWEEGNMAALWDEAVSAGDYLSKRSPSDTSQTKQRVWKAKRAIQDGRYIKACEVLTSDILATPSTEILQELQFEYPSSPSPPWEHPAPPDTLHVSVVRKCVMSFPNGSAPGPSGLRPSHLKEAIKCASQDRASRLLTFLTRFVNLLATGLAPRSINQHLCSAILLVLPKNDGGFHPIMVGEVLRRLVSKCLSMHIRHKAVSILSPLQLGFGVRGAREAIVHAAFQVMSADDDRNCVLVLNFDNAFSCINRKAMILEFRSHLPEISSWLEYCYSGQPLLHFGKNTIQSCSGIQQGDPLGPLCLAVTLHLVVKKIEEKIPSLSMNAWCLNEGILIGSFLDLLTALQIVEEHGPKLGLHLHHPKSLLFIPKQCKFSQSSLSYKIRIERNGFSLFGCPIGSMSTCKKVIKSHISKVKKCLKLLHGIGNAHLETTFLQSCLSLPMISNTLRTCPPNLVSKAIGDFDEAMKKSLEDILQCRISDWSWMKATLSTSKGGINLRSAAKHAPATFIASYARAQDLMEKILGRSPDPPSCLDQAVSDLAKETSHQNWKHLLDIDVPLIQNHLSQAIDEFNFQELLLSVSSWRDGTLAISTATPHAGDWLKNVPSAGTSLYMEDDEFRCCLKYWLGISLHSANYPCPHCHHIADKHGDHQIVCQDNVEIMTQEIQCLAAQLVPHADPQKTASPMPDSLSSYAELIHKLQNISQPVASKVLIVSPLQGNILNLLRDHLLNSGNHSLSASQLVHCSSSGVEFKPVVIETMGGLAENTIMVIKAIKKEMKRSDKISSSSDLSNTSQLFYRFAISLWKRNAHLWLKKKKQPPKLIES